jgi:hypothetical protein
MLRTREHAPTLDFSDVFTLDSLFKSIQELRSASIHQSPFGGVIHWDTPAVALTFTPSSYISLQVVTLTPIYTMEVNSASGKIQKFSERPGIISLWECKASFSIVVCELELNNGVNYTKAFAFK